MNRNRYLLVGSIFLDEWHWTAVDKKSGSSNLVHRLSLCDQKTGRSVSIDIHNDAPDALVYATRRSLVLRLRADRIGDVVR